jgi:hypothetical protein
LRNPRLAPPNSLAKKAARNRALRRSISRIFGSGLWKAISRLARCRSGRVVQVGRWHLAGLAQQMRFMNTRYQ